MRAEYTPFAFKLYEPAGLKDSRVPERKKFSSRNLLRFAGGLPSHTRIVTTVLKTSKSMRISAKNMNRPSRISNIRNQRTLQSNLPPSWSFTNQDQRPTSRILGPTSTFPKWRIWSWNFLTPRTGTHSNQVMSAHRINGPLSGCCRP